ncbi:MAG: hypothetical protein J6B89_01225 [Bacilli bacterium]|nr:hypothetical protein [Bacilli bacterium]
MQKDIDTWNYEYNLVRQLYEKIYNTEQPSLDSDNLKKLASKEVITKEEYNFYVNEFNIEQWIENQINQFHTNRLSKYKIIKLQQIDILNRNKCFTSEDQKVYNKLCLAIKEVRKHNLGCKEQTRLLEEVRNNINTSANIEKLLYNKLGIIKRYIDLNYYYQENQNYNLEDYIFACIEGIICALKNTKEIKNPSRHIILQIDKAVKKSCNIYFDEDINNIAIDEKYAFSETFNKDVDKDIDEFLNAILYNNLAKVGIRNIYLDLIDMLELGGYNIYEMLNYLSEKYNITNDIESYKNIIGRITNIIYQYLTEKYCLNDYNKKELIQTISKITFSQEEWTLKKDNLNTKIEIKHLLEEDMREYFPYLKQQQYNKITRWYIQIEQVIPKEVKLSKIEYKMMYQYISLTQEKRKELRDLILQLKKKRGIKPIEDNEIKELFYLIKKAPSSVIKLENLFINYDQKDNQIPLSNYNGPKTDILNNTKELADFLKTKSINITNSSIIEEAMEYKELDKIILNLISIEKDNIFQLLRKHAGKYYNTNLIEVFKIYYYNKNSKERKKALKAIGVDNPKPLLYKIRTLIKENLNNTNYPTVISDYMFLSNDKKYYKYKNK